MSADRDTFQPASRKQWRDWLQGHHGRTEGIWLVVWKKASGQANLDYDAAVDEALCFGWIDSKPRSLDERRSMRWFAPRKPGTGWSRANKLRIERAIAGGGMTVAGMAKIDAAKRDGSWAKLDDVENLIIPPDLALALTRTRGTAHFDAFPRTVKRSILEWIGQAKRPKTRAMRIDQTAVLAARNERANQWSR